MLKSVTHMLWLGFLVFPALTYAQPSVCAEFTATGYFDDTKVFEDRPVRGWHIPSGFYSIRGTYSYTPATGQATSIPKEDGGPGISWMFSQGVFQVEFAGRVWKTVNLPGRRNFSIEVARPDDPKEDYVGSHGYIVRSTVSESTAPPEARDNPQVLLVLHSSVPIFGIDDPPATVPNFYTAPTLTGIGQGVFNGGGFGLVLPFLTLGSPDLYSNNLSYNLLDNTSVTTFKSCSTEVAAGKWPPPYTIEPPSAEAAFKTVRLSDQPQKIAISARATGNPQSDQRTPP